MIYTKETLQRIVDYLNLRFPVAELSEELGYSKSAVSNYLSGKKPVSESFVKSIENKYNINGADFTEVGIKHQTSPQKIKDLASFIAQNQDVLMRDPLFKTVIESLFLRKEITRLRDDLDS